MTNLSAVTGFKLHDQSPLVLDFYVLNYNLARHLFCSITALLLFLEKHMGIILIKQAINKMNSLITQL